MRLPKSKAAYVTAATAVALLGSAGATYAATFKTVTVQDSGQRKVLRGFSTGTVGQFIERYDIHVNKRDRVSPTLDSPVHNHMTVSIVHPKAITLNDEGRVKKVWTFDHSVGQLLVDEGIKLSKSDHMSVEKDSSLTNREQIAIHSLTKKVSTETQKIPFQTIRRRSSALYSGHERVVTHGVEGLRQVKTTSVYRDGHKVSQSVTKKLVREPVDTVIEVGTKELTETHQYTLSSRSSSPATGLVKSALTVLATAYVAGGTTATGRSAEPGVVAVDPSVIPLGSKLYIPGVGTAIAADTGGAIRGNHIDICMGSESAAESWGERTVTVYIEH